jgi:hypothetical protein
MNRRVFEIIDHLVPGLFEYSSRREVSREGLFPLSQTACRHQSQQSNAHINMLISRLSDVSDGGTGSDIGWRSNDPHRGSARRKHGRGR